MFFIDEETKEKVFVISGVHNLTKQGESVCSTPRTVFLKVGLIQLDAFIIVVYLKSGIFSSNKMDRWIDCFL